MERWRVENGEDEEQDDEEEGGIGKKSELGKGESGEERGEEIRGE